MTEILTFMIISLSPYCDHLLGRDASENHTDSSKPRRISMNYRLFQPNLNDIIWTDGKFIIVADNYGCILTSTDGSKWDMYISGITLMFQPRAVVRFEDKVYALGPHGLISTKDTKAWVHFSSPAPFISSYLKLPMGGASTNFEAVFVSLNNVLVGLNEKYCDQVVYSCWKKIDLGSSYLCDVAWTWQGYVAVGIKGSIFTSMNGLSWQNNSTGIQNDLFSITSNADHIVAVGEKGTIIFKSKNGTQWHKANSGTKKTLLGIASSDKYFVAVGVDGTILISENGESWKLVGRNIQQRTLNSIAWSKKGYVAVGDKGTILFSKDATNWSIQNVDKRSLWFVIDDAG